MLGVRGVVGFAWHAWWGGVCLACVVGWGVLGMRGGVGCAWHAWPCFCWDRPALSNIVLLCLLLGAWALSFACAGTSLVGGMLFGVRFFYLPALSVL